MRAGHVSVNDIRSLVQRVSDSLPHMHEDIVRVVDVLGAIIPVPILFCSTWEVSVVPSTYPSSPTPMAQGFDRIIKAYAQDRPGSYYVQRGDYHVLRAEDSQIIDPSELATIVSAGMVLEISIILRQETTHRIIRALVPDATL